MIDEKVYVTEDGMEYILGERLILNDKRFLLLYQDNSSDVFIAYEENGNLIFIGEDYPGYNDIFGLLFEKFKANVS